ncbi:MAG: sulfatase-like hydrolase/transferase [Clostridia bacterium]|nr:sulfatase-like hydrolase/transferase [Clostridia bacterium]
MSFVKKEVIDTKKVNITEKKKCGIRIFYFFFAPFLLLCALEVMHLSYPHAAEAFFDSPFFFWKITITYVFLLATQCLFYTVTQSSFLSNCCNTVVMYALTFSSETLGRVNGNPLLPSDLLLIKNAKDIASFATIPFIWSTVISLALCVLCLVIHFVICRKQNKKPTIFRRMIYGVLSLWFSLTMIQSICFSIPFRYSILPKIGVQISAFNPIEDYQANGMVLTFFPRIGDLFVKPSSDYSEIAVNALKYKYEPPKAAANEEKPNVIIIQNEAFWDPTALPEVTYSVDLMSGIHSLKKNTVKGTFFSPVFGGGTCMPEFEVLTGISTSFLSASAYPYTQYITNETPSFVQAYRDNGYQTVALHPYKKNFYNRSTAYPLLGFDTFKGIEDFTYQESSGTYVDDMSCVKQMIEEYENKTADRIFQFVVTMENHGTYKHPRYESFDFEMEAPTLSEEDYMDLMRYSQGVYNADKAFMALVDYFKEVDEPVLIAMYGDHLPLLGTNGSTYMNGGMVEQAETFAYTNYPILYETPYVVWSNYKCSDLELYPRMSGYAFGTKLFLATGCEAPWYYAIVDQFSSKYPAVISLAKYDVNMERIKKFADEDATLIKDYQTLIYDILNGEQYCIKPWNILE